MPRDVDGALRAWQANRRQCTRSALDSHASSVHLRSGHRWLVNAGLIFSTRPGPCPPAGAAAPTPTRIPVQPALAGHSAGFSRVPLATGSCSRSAAPRPDHVEPPGDARGDFSAQSLRRSLSRAAPGDRCLTGRGGPSRAGNGPACAAAAAPGPLPRSGRAGRSPGGRRRGDRHARSMPRLAVTGAGPVGDHGEATCQRRPVHRDPVGFAPAARAGQRTGPPALGPGPGRLAGTRRRPAAAPPGDPDPSSRPALRHDGRPAGLPGSSRRHRPGEVAQPCCWTVGSRRPATGARPRGGGAGCSR